MVYGIGQRVQRAIFGLAVSVEGSERQFLDTDLKFDSELIGMYSGSQKLLGLTVSPSACDYISHHHCEVYERTYV